MQFLRYLVYYNYGIERCDKNSLAQLDKTYGTDPENQKVISDMIGTINVQQKGLNDSSSRSLGKSNGSSTGEDITFSDGKSHGMSRSISTSVSVVREPIIFPHELATLKDILLLTPDGFCRVEKLPYYEYLQPVSKG